MLTSHCHQSQSPTFCKLSVTSKPILAEQPLISCCGHFNNHWIYTPLLLKMVSISVYIVWIMVTWCIPCIYNPRTKARGSLWHTCRKLPLVLVLGSYMRGIHRVIMIHILHIILSVYIIIPQHIYMNALYIRQGYYTYVIWWYLCHACNLMLIALCVWFPPLCEAEQVLEDFREWFINDMEAKKVVLKLVHKCVISNGDEKTIASIEDRTLQNQTLHKYLKEKCTYETLKTACDAIMAVKGNPKMKA